MPDGFPAVGFPVAPGYKLALPLVVSHTRFVATCPQKDIPDFKVAQKIKTMGFRDSPTGELVFEDCEVPVENLVGEEDKGVAIVMGGFDLERAIVVSDLRGHGRARARVHDRLRQDP